MNAYKIRSIVMADGSIVLKGLPFSVGKSVEVIVATLIISGIPLLTADEKIIAYPDVTTLG
jgi:hypothetical protein